VKLHEDAPALGHGSRLAAMYEFRKGKEIESRKTDIGLHW
jgi:hypothetical protein